MQNLITGNNLLNLDEVKNTQATKPVTSEFSDKFNKIFKNATKRQDELSAQRQEPKRQTLQAAAKNDKPVEKTQESDETENVDKIIENLKTAIDLLNSQEGEAIVDDELVQSLTDALNKLIQAQNSGTKITDEMVQEIDELLAKFRSSGILTSSSGSEVKDKLNSIIVNIESALKEITGSPKAAKAEPVKGGVILVDENNIEAPKDKNSIKVDKNPEVSLKQVVEQKILDELNLNVDKVVVAAQQPQESAPKTTTNAGEQLIKLAIEKTAPGFEASTSFNNPQTGGHNFMGQNPQTNSVQVQETAAPQRFVDINKTDILNQIGSKFEQLKDAGSSRITLTLRPNDLGRVVIELNHNGNGVSTSIIAQNQTVKEMLEKNIEVLKQQLAAAGVNVQNINVKSAEFNPQGTFEDDGRQGGQQEGGSSDFTSSNGENKEQQEEQFEQESFIEHDGEVDLKG